MSDAGLCGKVFEVSGVRNVWWWLQEPKKQHTLDRKSVTEVKCAVCSTVQAVAAKCVECGVNFGGYCCLKCNLFDDDLSKEQYHCDACGICRVGGIENFFHCQKCNCCYHMTVKVCKCALRLEISELFLAEVWVWPVE